MRRYIRTCQSCGYELSASTETQDKTRNSYIYRKCPKCKSENFDYGSWQGYDTKPWRDRFKALTGCDLVMTENELDELISNDEDGGGLFEGGDFLKLLIERSKANAESIFSAFISYRD